MGAFRRRDIHRTDNMKLFVCTVLALSLVALCAGAESPEAFEDMDTELEFIEKVSSIKHAATKAKAHKKAASKAKKAVGKWSKVVAGLKKKSKKLNKAARAAAMSMAKSLRAQAKKLAASRAKSLAKMSATDKAEAKYNKKAVGLKKYKAAQAKIGLSIKKAQAQRVAIAKAMAKDAKKLKAARAAIQGKYKKKMAALAAQNKKNQAAFDKEEAAAQKMFASKNKSNKAKYAAVKKALAKAEKRNKASAKALAASIKRRFTKEKASKKKAAKAKRAFKADMREAAVKKAKAMNAQKQEKAAKKKAADNTKAQEKETKASTKKDMEIKECAIDGSECQTPNGKCHKTTPKGPFMDTDLVSCANKKPSEDMDAGLSWAGIPPPLALPPLPKPSKKCKALQKKVKKFLTGNPSKDMVTLGCKGTKKDLMAYFNMAAACPPLCKKGTATSDGRKQDTHGECIDGDTMSMFKMQITSMPVYKKMGTNGRFSAKAGAGSICTMVKNLSAGLGF